MQTTDGFDGLRCLDCGAEFGIDGPNRCADCGGALEPIYDESALETAHDELLDEQERTLIYTVEYLLSLHDALPSTFTA